MNYDLHVSPLKAQLWPLFSQISAGGLILRTCINIDHMVIVSLEHLNLKVPKKKSVYFNKRRVL